MLQDLTGVLIDDEFHELVFPDGTRQVAPVGLSREYDLHPVQKPGQAAVILRLVKRTPPGPAPHKPEATFTND